MENRKKRIAFYIGSLDKGGAERVIANLAEYFYSKEYEVYVVTKLKEKNEYALNDGITRIIADISKEEEKNRAWNLYARVHKLRGIWKRIKPDIIVSFIRKNNVMAIASSRFLHIPVVVSVRSDPARELKGRGMKLLSFFLFRFADGIVLQTSQAKAFFPDYLKKKAVILPNSINPSFLNAQGAVEKKKEIAAVGRIDKNKNQKMLLEAFADIAADYPDWCVRLYGDGEEAQSLKEYVDEKGLEKQIFFMGQISNVAEKVKEASVFVLPSRCEGMPNALIEAMTLGTAVVSTDCPCGGPADLIENGKNGILIPVDDQDALKDALIRLIEDEDYRREMGQNASVIRNRLHPDIVNKQWEDYLETILRKC